MARSRAYRWGEDGLAGVSDDKALVCLALALWNGQDPIVKERLFGLTNSEGNHGEDVKEYYFYVDNTPTHSWMRWRYKYPHAAYPYDDLVRTNAERGYGDREYELLDTGVFDDDRYFDVEVDYAKAGPDDLLMRVTVRNRGDVEARRSHVLPTLWFRNTWSSDPAVEKPTLEVIAGPRPAVHVHHPVVGDYYLHAPDGAALLFTENETNTERLFGTANASPFVKDGVETALLHGRADAVNGERRDEGRRPPLGRGPRGRRGHVDLRLDQEPPGPAEPARRRRRGARRTPRGGRRVLRRHHPAEHGRGHGRRDAPGARGNAVEQAVLLLRPRHAGCASTAATRSGHPTAPASATPSGST